MLLKTKVVPVFLTLIVGLYASTIFATPETRIRGVLVWTPDKQTITECKSGRIYWVRVLASNPHFLLGKKVDELNPKGTETIFAELSGEVEMGKSSLGPTYPVDGMIRVHQIISVTKGSCQ